MPLFYLSARRSHPAPCPLQDPTNDNPAVEAERAARRDEHARRLTLQDSPSRCFRRTTSRNEDENRERSPTLSQRHPAPHPRPRLLPRVHVRTHLVCPRYI